MLFFGTRCERLCLTQFSLISLIPRLLHNLQDSAGPELDSYERNLTMPTSLRTSDRNSLLAYMGLPLQIFGKVRVISLAVFPPLDTSWLLSSLPFPLSPLSTLYTSHRRIRIK